MEKFTNPTKKTTTQGLDPRVWDKIYYRENKGLAGDELVEVINKDNKLSN